ncbi:unnamed protein product [Aphis gossypii]|uniref:Uncharacterized protein n=1 Tax=Aphis gossypii TaxID=80765 RepID=A0A9P0NE08_APHGO|nr:unnamed protein product [Aphis gossypii]
MEHTCSYRIIDTHELHNTFLEIRTLLISRVSRGRVCMYAVNIYYSCGVLYYLCIVLSCKACFFSIARYKRDRNRLKTHSAASLFRARIYVNRHVLRHANLNREKKLRYRSTHINNKYDIYIVIYIIIRYLLLITMLKIKTIFFFNKNYLECLRTLVGKTIIFF